MFDELRFSIFPRDEGGWARKSSKDIESEVTESSAIRDSLVREEPGPGIFSEEFVDKDSVDFFELISLVIIEGLLESLSHSLDGIEIEFLNKIIKIFKTDIVESTNILNIGGVRRNVVSESVSENFWDILGLKHILLSVLFSLYFFIL